MAVVELLPVECKEAEGIPAEGEEIEGPDSAPPAAPLLMRHRTHDPYEDVVPPDEPMVLERHQTDQDETIFAHCDYYGRQEQIPAAHWPGALDGVQYAPPSHLFQVGAQPCIPMHCPYPVGWPQGTAGFPHNLPVGEAAFMVPVYSGVGMVVPVVASMRPQEAAKESMPGEFPIQYLAQAVPDACAPPRPVPSAVAQSPQNLNVQNCPDEGKLKVTWVVEAKKLKTTEKQHVSPPFVLPFQQMQVGFKLILKPKAVGTAKGQASFKASKGKGTVHLKCEGEVASASANMHFNLRVGGEGVQMRPHGGPQACNFNQGNLHGLPQEEEEWDLDAAVDRETQTFLVCLEILGNSSFVA